MHIPGDNGQHVLVLDRGDKVLETLTQFIASHHFKGAAIYGIGAICKIEMGFYDLEKKDYLRKTFNDSPEYELISFQGNASMKDGLPYVHAHCSFSGPDFIAKGGHLFEAEVAVTAEFHIQEIGLMPERKMNEVLGLQTICGFSHGV